jgi:hypothetical protein
VSKLLVGVIHLPPLPGSPRAWPLAQTLAQVSHDARALADAGFDRVMVENFGDAPFFADRVPPVTVAAMTACLLAAREAGAPTGVNVLRNDVESALSIAACVGAVCVRVNVHIGARVTDQGLVQGRAADTLRLRRALGADHVAIWADVDVKHSAPLGPRPIEAEVADAVDRGLADAVLVTGSGTGHAVDMATLAAVRRATAAPVYVASGVDHGSVASILGACDGAIVGSALRVGGKPGGPIDRALAESFMRRARP